jgi:dolichol-phosphate mannosyltransferase
MIYFLIPTYNEEENIKKLFLSFENILSTNFKSEKVCFIFSDDGSKDNTINEINNWFKPFSFVVLKSEVNKGPGSAFNKGFEYILQNSHSDDDIVVTLEADGTSDLAILPVMIGINRLGFDLVLASVYAQGGGFDKTTFIRKSISFIANLLFRFLFNIKVLTLSSFYRVYKISLLKEIKIKYNNIIEEDGFICMLEVLIKAIDLNAKIIEVPMKLRSNQRIGKSKMKLLKTTFHYIRFLIYHRWSCFRKQDN